MSTARDCSRVVVLFTFALLVCTVGVQFAAPTVASAKSSTSMVTSVSSSLVAPGTSVRVAATLRHGSTPVKYARVSIQGRAIGGSWQRLVLGKTNSHGRCSIDTAKLASARQFRAVFGGNARFGASVSKVRTVRIRGAIPVIGLMVAHRTNSAITLQWQNPALWSGDTLQVRRAAGAVPPLSLSTGQVVPVSSTAASVTDSHLNRMTAYAYSVFVVAANGAVVGCSTITTSTAGSASSLSEGDVLYGGQSLRSPSGQYILVMQTDGNLVEYYRNTGHALWSSGSAGHPGASVRLQSDGNLVVYDSDGHALWSSATAGKSSVHVDVQNDGNVVAYYQGGAKGISGVNGVLYPGGTLLSGESLISGNGSFSLQMQGDGNLVLYDVRQTPSKALWSTHTQGNNWAVMQGDGNLVVYDQSGVAKWSSGTAGHAGARLVVQTDGNLVIYDGSAIWASSTAPGSSYASKYGAFINDSRWANGTAWGYYQTPKLSTWSSIGCCAYVADFCTYVFGKTSFNNCVSTFTSVDDIRAGDVLHIYNATYGEHWIAVLTRSGNTLYTAEGNWSSKVRIGNNYSIVGSMLSGSYTLTKGYHMQ